MNPSTDELLALHGLRLKGLAPLETLARYLDRPVDVVERRLALAADDGHARYRDGARPGWTLTGEGQKEGERLLAEELDATDGLRATVTDVHRRFRPLNAELLQVCTDWQVVDVELGILNDHTDPARDAAVIKRLADVDSKIQPLCSRLADALDRFGHYGPRLGAALQRVLAGDHDWFAKPTIDSYHTVWFELHEDLLATLGLDRVTERTSNNERRE
jgi:hypothetical protein